MRSFLANRINYITVLTRREEIVNRCGELAEQLVKDYWATDRCSHIIKELDNLKGARAALVLQYMRDSMTRSERICFDADFEKALAGE